MNLIKLIGDNVIKKKFTIVLFMMIIALSTGVVYLRHVSYSYNDKENNNTIYLIDTIKKDNNVINKLPDITLSSDNGNDLAGLYKDEDEYYFRGNVDNNYVSLEDMLWRVVSFTDDEIKIVLENGIMNNQEFAYDDTKYITSYEESNIINEVNNWYKNYLTSLNFEIENIGILDYDTVIKAGASNLTNNESFFLYNENDTWLSTIKEDDIEIESSIIWFLSDNGMLDIAFPEESKTIRPTITIRNPILLNGDGTKESPYYLT